MIYYFFALVTAAFILLMNNPRSEMNRWAAFFLSAAAIGGLTDVLIRYGYDDWANIEQLLNHTLSPYGILIFSVVYSELVPGKRARLYLKLALLVIPAWMMLSTPIKPEIRLDYRFLLGWAAPYYLAACLLLIVSLWKETNRRKRRNRFIATLIIVPTILAVLLLINVAAVVAPELDAFRYVSLFIIYSLSVALICTFIYGVLGVRLRFEKDPLEGTMKAVSSGAVQLNHSIKNEIGKIAISSDNLKRELAERSPDSLSHLAIITSASDHMLGMVNRIHSQMRDIVLSEKPFKLDQLVQSSLAKHKGLFEQKEIRVRGDYACSPTVIGDPVHFAEALGNVLVNAAEAVETGGVIHISLEREKKSVQLRIKDNGRGIAADQLERIFEPFFSTKNRSSNFGLGLSYVYNVMKKSGGSVDVMSRENEGTTVIFHFAAKSIRFG
ncbi:histidine kinase/DNA gyrase B/HSP90-like ATPase [Paenibacillus sp. BK033]|uniref:sensor histidine kinase n=1 Tax=Paenibacillus sp. BK033 TaxID=2512133 RepID=UPI00105058D8|nr:HAMP domain-containing sensor histidine kinase [Paenibacillus sp. BK033]TCM96160.1 histidine kinase/DNA gyrase B/HSP90-like ATPase [Paenibacillus sp. BK033]